MSNWENAYYWLSTDAAASLQVPLTGGVAAGYKRRIFVADAGGWKDCLAEDNVTWVRYGVAVRLVIRVDYISADLKVSLPGLAAEAQLNNVLTQSILRIQGYVGDGFQLPDWKEYNVETYRELMEQANKIKNVIIKNKAGMRPEPLMVASDLVGDSNDPAADDVTAVARVWALRELAHGESCERTIAQYGAKPDSPLGRRIADVYERLAGECSARRPSDDGRDAAYDALGILG